MKKIIQRKLPLSDKYRVLEVYRGGIEDSDGCVCENCGALIVNIATIQNQDGKKFSVGLDCVKTLTATILNTEDYQQAVYEFNQCLKFISFLKKASTVKHDKHMIWVDYRDSKDRFCKDSIFKGSLDKYKFKYDQYLVNAEVETFFNGFKTIT